MKLDSELVTLLVLFAFFVVLLGLLYIWCMWDSKRLKCSSLLPVTLPPPFSQARECSRLYPMTSLPTSSPANFPATPPRSSSVFTECGSGTYSQSFSPEPNPQTQEEVIPQLIAAALNFKEYYEEFEDVKLNQLYSLMEPQMYDEIGEECLRLLIRHEAYGHESIVSILGRMHMKKVERAIAVSYLRRTAMEFKKKFQELEDEKLKEAYNKLSAKMFNDIEELHLRYLVHAEAFCGQPTFSFF